LERQRWDSPLVDSAVIGVGWSVPACTTFKRWNQRYLVGTAHPAI